MPIPGVSLVGFMSQQHGTDYLLRVCIPANPDPAAVIADWQCAKAKLGNPAKNTGRPVIANLPSVHGGYIQQLCGQPWLAPFFQIGCEVKLVELDPLLAFQFHVAVPQATHHTASLKHPVSLYDLLPICLPMTPESVQYNISVGPQSVLMRSKSLNLRLFEAGVFPQIPGVAGINFGSGLPHVQVCRYNGRCYLTNGFHRAFGLRAFGVTSVPCLFRDVATPLEAGIVGNGGMFDLALLESSDPPTCAHFAQNRSHAVALRRVSKIIQVSWCEHVVDDE